MLMFYSTPYLIEAAQLTQMLFIYQALFLE